MAVESRDKTLHPFVYLLMKSIVSNRLYVGLVHLISHMGLAGDVGLTDLVGLTNHDARCVLFSLIIIKAYMVRPNCLVVLTQSK